MAAVTPPALRFFEMKIVVFIMLLGAFLPTQSSANTVTAIKFQEGQKTEFVSKKRDQMTALSLELLRTADYEAAPSVATEARFKQAKQAPHLHLTFTPPHTIAFCFSTTGPTSEKTVEITELVIPIPSASYPDYIFVREQGRIRAFAKYSPQSWQTLRNAMKDK